MKGPLPGEPGESQGNSTIIEDMAWNLLMQPTTANHGLRDSLHSIGCSYNVQDMRPNPMHRVWHDPEADEEGNGVPAIVDDSSDDELWQAVDGAADGSADPGVGTDDLMPAIVGDTSDDELWHHEGDTATLIADQHFDTDDELGYDDWYDARRGICRGKLRASWAPRDRLTPLTGP